MFFLDIWRCWELVSCKTNFFSMSKLETTKVRQSRLFYPMDPLITTNRSMYYYYFNLKYVHGNTYFQNKEICPSNRIPIWWCWSADLTDTSIPQEPSWCIGSRPCISYLVSQKVRVFFDISYDPLLLHGLRLKFLKEIYTLLWQISAHEMFEEK